MEKTIRNCVACKSDFFDELFEFNYDFLVNIFGYNTTNLELLGWNEKITSSIVRCRECRTAYVRDVVNAAVESKNDGLRNLKLRRGMQGVLRTISQKALMRELLGISGSSDPKLLDFGAGSGEMCNAARKLGVTDVSAYDPYGSWGGRAYRLFNKPGIKFTRNFGDLKREGKFNIIICQWVIEHTMDPSGEIAAINDMLDDNGVAYFKSRIFNVDKDLPRLVKTKKMRRKDSKKTYRPSHLNYLSGEQLRRMFKYNGFTILKDNKPWEKIKDVYGTVKSLSRPFSCSCSYLCRKT
jgi:2-polyprenyl-3-methyl-5-hydroxy-6-metoxy-1,4-benzoquinol methylase